MDKHSQNINGNPSVTNAQLGDTIRYHVVPTYYSALGTERTVQNGKLIFLVDPELEFDSALHHPYQAQYRFTLNTTHREWIIIRVPEKLPMCLIWIIYLSKGEAWGVDRLYIDSTYHKSEEGEHTVEAFLKLG